MRWAGKWRGIRIRPAFNSASSIRAKAQRCAPCASQCDKKLYRQVHAGNVGASGRTDDRRRYGRSPARRRTERSAAWSRTGASHIQAKAVILTSGTFLKGFIHIGLNHFPAGRAGEASAEHLSDCMRDLGFEVGRLKTGTPPRLDARPIDFSVMAPQPGDDPPPPFSYRTRPDSEPAASPAI